MAAPVQWLYDPTFPVLVPFGASQVLTVGDICGIDTNGLLYRGEDQTWNTDEATTRVDFVAKFAGVVAQSKRTADVRPYGNSAAVARVSTSAVFEADLDTGTTLKVGDWVGLAKQAGNALYSQIVKKVTAENQAIGRVVEAGTTLTRVKFRIYSTNQQLSK